MAGLVRGDAMRNHLPGYRVAQNIAVEVKLSNRKGTVIVVSASIHDYFFTDIGGADKESSTRIPTHRKVIEFEGGSRSLLPHAHAEISG